MWTSTVPAALTGLVTAFQAGVPSAHVRKGIAVGNSSRVDAVTVGAGSDMGAAVEAHPSDGGPRVQLENYTVNCVIESLTGSRDIEITIVRAMALLTACGDALTTDQTLGGSVMRARISQYSLTFEQTKRGPVVKIVFGVDVEARLSR